jgi:hypothetical protein
VTALGEAFPAALGDDVRVVEARLVTTHELHEGAPLMLSTGPVRIPARVYLQGMGPGPELTPQQQRILDCICTRDHDGYVRQRHVERLLGPYEEWVCPFVFLLVGEYVVEIIERIAARLGSLDRAQYAAFIARNPALFQRTWQRATSYWDVYYRSRFRKVTDYPGRVVLSALRSPA